MGKEKTGWTTQLQLGPKRALFQFHWEGKEALPPGPRVSLLRQSEEKGKPKSTCLVRKKRGGAKLPLFQRLPMNSLSLSRA